MGFPRQEDWSGLPLPSPGDLPDPVIKSASPVSPALQEESSPTEPPRKPNSIFELFLHIVKPLLGGESYGMLPTSTQSPRAAGPEGCRCWLLILLFSRSVVCLTLCDLVDNSTPGFPVLHSLLECAQTHVHWVDDAIQPPHPRLPPSPPALNLCQHQGLFQWLLFTSPPTHRKNWPWADHTFFTSGLATLLPKLGRVVWGQEPALSPPAWQSSEAVLFPLHQTLSSRSDSAQGYTEAELSASNLLSESLRAWIKFKSSLLLICLVSTLSVQPQELKSDG